MINAQVDLSAYSLAIRYNHLCAFSYIIINLPIQVITNEVHKVSFILHAKVIVLITMWYSSSLVRSLYPLK